MLQRTRFSSFLLALIALCARIDAQCELDLLEVTATQLNPGSSNVGHALAASGDRFVTSSAGEFIFPLPGDPTTGAVYVHANDGSGWALEQRIFFPGMTSIDAFGFDVAISGDWMAVSIPSGCVGDFLQGACPPGRVALYERGVDGWQLAQLVQPSDSQVDDLFGVSIDLQGDLLVVGATGQNDVEGTAPGAAYVFENLPGGWLETARLEGDPQALFGFFGKEVSVDGDTLVVAAVGEPTEQISDGALYVFERTDGSWVQTQRLEVPFWSNGTISYKFRESLDVSGSTIVVGIPRLGQVTGFPLVVPAGGQNGAAFVFSKVAGDWMQTATLHASDPTTDALFGASVAVDGNRILVGASVGEGVTLQTGNAYLFELTSLGWVQRAKLFSPDALGQFGGERFGFAVALEGEHVLVGEPLGSASGFIQSGAVYAGSLDDLPCPGQTLSGAPGLIPVSSGGNQVLGIEAGAANAGNVYFVLGSATGTTPGFTVPPGVHVPLQPDAWFQITATIPNLFPFQSTLGLLDAQGAAVARIDIPGAVLDQSFVGVSLFHSSVVLDLATLDPTFATEAAALTFVP